jgi:hypothetical protein
MGAVNGSHTGKKWGQISNLDSPCVYGTELTLGQGSLLVVSSMLETPSPMLHLTHFHVPRVQSRAKEGSGDSERQVNRWIDEWMDGWMDGYM